jgi:hypothetical protein
MRMLRAFVAWVGLVPVSAVAGTLYGKVELPAAPERPPAATKGFLDRVENPLAPVRALDVTRQMVIVVEGEEKPVSPPQINWDLAGESFSRPVIAVPAGAEVVIKDTSRTARTLVAKEDAKLIPQGPINPTGTKSFRVNEVGKVFTIGDKDAPHLVGKLVVVNTQFIAYPDESGRFEIADIPAGSYKLKIWYRDGWITRDDDSVNVTAKGKTDFNPKVPAGAFGGKK